MTGARRAAARDSASIALAVGVYAVSFGVLAVSAGLTELQAIAMSLLVFTGASQIAAVGVLATGGTALAAVVPALLLGARNAVYGVVVAPILTGRRATRALKAQLVIDESTAMARAIPEDPQFAFLATGLGIYVCWSAGTAIGAIAGASIADPKALGLDAMFPAAFLALLAPQIRQPGAPLAALLGAVIALPLVPFVPAGVPILAAVLAVVPAVRAAR
jgi:4-azaleucine resistance transporter AzlC